MTPNYGKLGNITFSFILQLKGTPLEGRRLALPKNIRLGWKGLLSQNTPAYYDYLYSRAVKV
jgi:hypothetical protein